MLSLEQQAQIRLYLGYSDASRGSGGSDLDRAMTSLSTAAEGLVSGTLASLTALDTRLSGAWDRQAVTRAEEVEMAGPGELRALRSEGRRLVRRLASMLGVVVMNDVFSDGGGVGGPCRRG